MDAKAHDELSFPMFYKREYAQMLLYCLLLLRKYSEKKHEPDRADAEDIVADAFTVLLSVWDTFFPHTEPVLTAWIQKTVKNKVYTFLKNRAKSPPTVELQEWLEKEEERPEDGADEPPPDPEKDELLYIKYLAAVRERLNKKQQRLFDCVIVRKKTAAEAARLLSMKENTVQVSLYRMRKKIREKILPEILKKN